MTIVFASLGTLPEDRGTILSSDLRPRLTSAYLVRFIAFALPYCSHGQEYNQLYRAATSDMLHVRRNRVIKPLHCNQFFMRIYVAHSTSFDYKNELYLPIRQSDLNAQHDFILPHELSNEQYDSHALFTSGIDLVVAEVSYPSTGLGIELGWADSSGAPIACFYKVGTTPSGSLQAVTDKIVGYSSHKELISRIGDIINKM